MATVLSNSQYVEYQPSKGKNLPLNKLFVEIYFGASKKLVSLNELFVLTGEKNGAKSGRPVKSYDDFIKHLKADNVYFRLS